MAAVVTSSGPTAAAPWSPAPRQVAPYVDVTGALPADPGSLVGPSGPGDAVLAFVLAGDGECTPSWGGTVPLDEVIGRADWIGWPIDRWRSLDRPATFAAIPGPGGGHG